MSKSVVVTARIDERTGQDLDRLAAEFERSRAWIVAKAISSFVNAEIGLSDLLKEGEDAIARGDYLTEEEMDAWFDEKIAGAEACRAERAKAA